MTTDDDHIENLRRLTMLGDSGIQMTPYAPAFFSLVMPKEPTQAEQRQWAIIDRAKRRIALRNKWIVAGLTILFTLITIPVAAGLLYFLFKNGYMTNTILDMGIGVAWALSLIAFNMWIRVYFETNRHYIVFKHRNKYY